MLIKINELKNFELKNINFYLFYGENIGLIDETINKIFKPNFLGNIIRYDENEIINNINAFNEEIYNQSFFDNDKVIIINRGSDRIVKLIEEIINKNFKDLKIIIKSQVLEKKSKLRNLFEKKNNTVITPFYKDTHQLLTLLIRNFFKEKKLAISNEIINLIIERSRNNRIDIINEINKISQYAINKNQIFLEDVLKLTNLSQNYEISELVNQNLSKNKKKTINILNENSLNTEDNILVLKTYLNKLKRLKILKINLEKNKNIELILSSFRPPIFWKDKDIIKKQLNILSLVEIKYLINKINSLELEIKKNNQISDQILNNFILENLASTNNIT
jgi:DNA polymerase-3 subunit delta